MPLETLLFGLQLRGILALTVRTGRRLLPLIDQHPGAEEISRQAISLAADFVEGAPLTRLRSRVALDALAGVEREEAKWRVVVETAQAGDYANRYGSSRNPELAHQAFEHARGAMKRAEEAGGDEITAPAKRDLAALADTYSGEVEQLGDPLELDAFGPLGLLWDIEEVQPEWMPTLPDPVIMTPETFISPGEIKNHNADFVCFDGRKDLGTVYETLYAAAHSEAQAFLSPRPGFFVYSPGLDPSQRLELNALGAVAVTSKRICNHIPKNVAEFAKLLVAQMNEDRIERLPLDRAARRRQEEALRFVEASAGEQADEPEQPGSATDEADANRQYERVLEDLLVFEGRSPSH